MINGDRKAGVCRGQCLAEIHYNLGIIYGYDRDTPENEAKAVK